MEVIIRQSEAELAAIAAEAIRDLYRENPTAVLGVATGSSPLPIYEKLSEMVADGSLSLKQAKAFMLDEYVGLPVDHPEGYRNFIERYFVATTDICTENVYGPDGQTSDPVAACAEYEKMIEAAGGVDLQILGVGVDGHIAFNEPGTSLGSLTHIEVLTEQTRQSNSRFFDNDINKVPRLALSQGVGTILRSKQAVLIATGEDKAEAIRGIVEGPVTSMCTGSALQLHPNVKILIDEAAASKLATADYHRAIGAARPEGIVWLGV